MIRIRAHSKQVHPAKLTLSDLLDDRVVPDEILVAVDRVLVATIKFQMGKNDRQKWRLESFMLTMVSMQ